MDLLSRKINDFFCKKARNELVARPDNQHRQMFSKDALKSHTEAQHMDMAKFECEYSDCEQKFKYKSGLVRHLQRDHLKLQLPCEVCGR